MEIDNVRPVYRKPPLPNKKIKQRDSETTNDSPQGVNPTDQKKGVSSRFPPLHLPKFTSLRKIENEADSSIDSSRYRSRQRVATNTSLRSVRSGSARSNSSCRSSNRSSQRLISNQKRFIPNISAHSWIAYQMNQGKVIHGKRINKKRQMASLTKIMNLITAIQILEAYKLQPQKIRVRVSKEASNIIGTTALLRQGMQLSLYDLMFGIMLPSGNDAAYNMAQVIGAIVSEKGNIKESTIYNVDQLSELYLKKKKPVLNFLQEMNKIAQKLDMANSRFTNPHGLSQMTNTSTAEDLAKLCSFAIKNSLFFKVVNTKQYHATYRIKKDMKDLQNINEECFQEEITESNLIWTNTNKMLWEGWHGLKTGVTPNAGPCLAACIKKTINGFENHILVILLSSVSMDARWKQVKQIVNWSISQNYLS